MRADAYAKVNLSLRVGPADGSGLHPLRSLVHSIDWADGVDLEEADEDCFDLTGPVAVAADQSNLAVRALEAVRPPGSGPIALRLDKHIPVAAGLGGGSADAAAVLTLAAAHFHLDPGRVIDAAPGIGADVPFCLLGGAAWMEGYGERLTPVRPCEDFAVAVVVPPFPLTTADVYSRWDRLGEPEGIPIDARHLPDSLRGEAPLANDLTPAALDLAPELGDWTSDLHRKWGVPVLMSGSGPSLFGFFATHGEAAEAIDAVQGARAARACLPVAAGVRVEGGRSD
jgi:4-diphosphocytidyl-2-C-methyl-D-erythritol kinase